LLSSGGVEPPLTRLVLVAPHERDPFADEVSRPLDRPLDRLDARRMKRHRLLAPAKIEKTRFVPTFRISL